jgi:hypothetical protein
MVESSSAMVHLISGWKPGAGFLGPTLGAIGVAVLNAFGHLGPQAGCGFFNRRGPLGKPPASFSASGALMRGRQGSTGSVGAGVSCG